MSETTRLEAIVRTEFGKGAARRTRRDGNVPAVLYGHHTDPQHLALNARAFAAALRLNGTNAVLTLNIDGKDQLALTKSVVVHPVRRHIEHADLLVIKRGEKVTVDISVVVTGEVIGGAVLTQETATISVEADALNIPEQVEVSVEGAEVGTQILAGQLQLPKGVTLQVDPDALIVNVVAQRAEEPEAGAETEGEAGAEGQATEGE
jgi:large subunit ribosomal protein L25